MSPNYNIFPPKVLSFFKRSHITLALVDVNGYEDLTFFGAAKFLTETPPCIIFLVTYPLLIKQQGKSQPHVIEPNPFLGRDPAAMWDYLKGKGYVVDVRVLSKTPGANAPPEEGKEFVLEQTDLTSCLARISN